ncbi:MAG: L-serine ammonia-lyase, iron-sulfur-dependent, subunit alpha [Bacteroidales bacterium]|nr:L-serine ammonia-lyase, iron-sulfur-dependent, subunit alpha [Anaerotignum sp.]MCI5679452.1 L-serine ammonia-lyase, iron-sulfur-dependent, subunit alpha [Bacteroidales bacterium]MDY3926046.1 L-serine ammonia-lyase, iron-sulfur-dependent, subunit alpha [Anaerotignum sp.]
MKYDSLAELVAAAEAENMTLSAYILKDQAAIAEKTEEELYKNMERALQVMKESVEDGLDPVKRSASGLTGGDAFKMNEAVKNGRNICGPFFGKAMVKALAVSQTNACMGRIVASPTAGSCGILPSALLTLAEERNIPDKDLVMALFTASAVGIVIATNASVAGAAGGCQAECGAASAMAAAAMVELCGGTPKQCEHACAIALKNILGLVCDPVAGLVEIPCIKRNAGGVGNAMVAAELALAGIESHIPADEVIVAMKKVGDTMSPALKETAEGGLACTPTGKKLCEKVFGCC